MQLLSCCYCCCWAKSIAGACTSHACLSLPVVVVGLLSDAGARWIIQWETTTATRKLIEEASERIAVGSARIADTRRLSGARGGGAIAMAAAGQRDDSKLAASIESEKQQQQDRIQTTNVDTSGCCDHNQVSCDGLPEPAETAGAAAAAATEASQAPSYANRPKRRRRTKEQQQQQQQKQQQPPLQQQQQ